MVDLVVAVIDNVDDGVEVVEFVILVELVNTNVVGVAFGSGMHDRKL